MEVAIAIILIAIYLGLIYLFFVYIASYVILFGTIFLFAAVFWNYFQAIGESLFWGTGWVDSPVGPEPAYKNL